jgi:radical SAM superfamily enzyme YgiQ (UPF0313 family)
MPTADDHRVVPKAGRVQRYRATVRSLAGVVAVREDRCINWGLAMFRATAGPGFLLIGPYDPTCGEYTFLAPPLGVWRLAGVLDSAGFRAAVFDPNCCDGDVEQALEAAISSAEWDVIGVSTTGMTLRYDLQLAHLARRLAPTAVIVAGGMEATFQPELMFELGPFDLVVLGEGEQPLLELGARLRARQPLGGIGGTAEPPAAGTGAVLKLTQPALTQAELRDAIFQTPYEAMPYPRYWDRLERAYRVGALPAKAAREAALAEIRSVRLISLNYCPMNCSFCSATNFLHEAQGSVAPVARLDAEQCLAMLERIVAAQPLVRTVIFQDDIFAFTKDRRVLLLCDAICRAKALGTLPQNLQFISTNRIDAVNDERLTAMRRAGFRVLGFGIESFSRRVLSEFNKAQIYPHITPVLTSALALGITPFLDLILTSPRSTLADLAETVRMAVRWLAAGCEIGMYPYVIPFSGAALARDRSLLPHTIFAHRRVRGTAIAWNQPAKILPIDADTRDAILEIERDYEAELARRETGTGHLPSRVRSLLWVLAALPVLAKHGHRVAPAADVDALLAARTPIDASDRFEDLPLLAVAP